MDHPPLEDLPETEFINATIEPGKVLQLDIKAEKGQKIIWNFRTEGHDIRFGVSFEVNKQVIINSCRVDSHELTQKGTLHVEKTGKCKIYPLFLIASMYMYTRFLQGICVSRHFTVGQFVQYVHQERASLCHDRQEHLKFMLAPAMLGPFGRQTPQLWHQK